MSENLTKDSDTEGEYGEAKKKVMDIGEKVKAKTAQKMERIKGQRRMTSSL